LKNFKAELKYNFSFNSEIIQDSKNNVCKFLFKHLSENFLQENLFSDGHLKKAINETANSLEAIFDSIFELKLSPHNPINKVIDINSVNTNNHEPAVNEYYNINDSKLYINKNLEEKNGTANKNNYEDINEISFNNILKDKININNIVNYKYISNQDKMSNSKTSNNPPTLTLNNFSLSNNNMNNNYNNSNQNAILEEYENLLNNLNENILGIQKDLNLLLLNVHQYTEKDLLQIDLNQKFSLKNHSTNNLHNMNNDTFINLNLENKNSENIFEDSLFLKHRNSKKRNFDDTNLIYKNNISCNQILTNNPNTNFIYTVENLFTNIFKIKAYLKLINISSFQKNKLGDNKEGN